MRHTEKQKLLNAVDDLSEAAERHFLEEEESDSYYQGYMDACSRIKHMIETQNYQFYSDVPNFKREIA